MPGFFLEINSSNGEVQFKYNPSLINEALTDEGFYARRSTINKFVNDKVFFNSNEFFIVLEGVIFNKSKLLKKHGTFEKWNDCIISMYNIIGDTFFSEFRGSFSGALFDKKMNKWLVFTDQIGSKQLYYTKINESYLISSEIKWLTNVYKQAGKTYTIDNDGAVMLLTHGFMLEDHTLINEINKINAGFYLEIVKNKQTKKQYFILDNTTDNETSENEFIEQIDKLFLEAVQEQFEKNREYGYSNFNTLSGGLDSRMTLFAANKLGYKDIINITFAQSGSLDEKIASNISENLYYEWLFKSLDNGLFLMNIDNITEINQGIALNYGHAHQFSAYKILEKSNIGILHTGQLGDVVVGTFYTKNIENNPYNIGDGVYSRTKLDLLKDVKLSFKYSNQEVFNFYNRGFNGANSGLVIAQEFTEPFSPFYQLEFLKKALSIPVEMRFNHKFYKKWIISKYPKAIKYPWERTKNLITSTPIKILGKFIYPNQIPSILKRKVFKIKNKTNNPLTRFESMNPLDYYYQTNNELKTYWDSYFNTHKHFIPESLLEVTQDLYDNGNAVEKNMVLSLISALKYYFNDQ